MIKIAICDDEVSAILAISGKIQGYMEAKQLEYIASKFLSGEDLLQTIVGKQCRFDAIFLDIQMERINGISVAKSIRKAGCNATIVFVTALKDYVFDAFDVNAMQYLLKPIVDEKLFTVLKKISLATCATKDEYLVISKGGEIRKVALTDIMYCEVVNHRVFVYENGYTSEFGSKIDNLEKKLNSNFFRCHRSYIVNLKYVDHYKNGVAILPSGEKIPIATRRQTDFMKALLNFQRNEVR